VYDARRRARNDLVAPIFADTAVKSVKSRALFDTYLVRDMQVLRHETVGVEFTYNAAPTGGVQPTPVTTHSGGGTTDHLPMDRYRAMTARFPHVQLPSAPVSITGTLRAGARAEAGATILALRGREVLDVATSADDGSLHADSRRAG